MRVIVYVIAVGALYLTGCYGNGEPECGSDASCPPPIPDEDIVGLWDRSEDIEAGTDVLYTHIGAEGNLNIYDFQQDDLGNGENCFILYSGFITRSSVTSDVYDIDTADEVDSMGISERLTIIRQSNSLRVRRASGNEETWTQLVGVQREDLLLCQ